MTEAAIERLIRKRLRAHPPSESTGQFIRDYLLKHGKAHVWVLFQGWCKHLHDLKMKAPKEKSFFKYVSILRRINLIRKTSSPPYKKQSRFPRQYYELVPSQVDSKAWNNPQAALDLRLGRTIRDSGTGKLVPVSKLGRRRYRRRVKKLPPEKVGRPTKRSRGQKSQMDLIKEMSLPEGE